MPVAELQKVESPFIHLEVTDMGDVPPIAEQTSWPSGIFKIQTPENIRYFNCSVIRNKDGLWLFSRRARNIKGDWMGRNDIVAHLFDENTKQIRASVEVIIPKVYEKEHYEDPRVMWMDGGIWMSACSFIPGMFYGAHQRLCRLDSTFHSGRPISPVYGGNGHTPLMQARNHEKNWLWFEHARKPFMVYQAVPHQVLEWPDFSTFSSPLVYETRMGSFDWHYGELRGGTPPIRVGGEYWTFFHSSLPWRKPKRQYFMGAYAFSVEPPFRMTRMSVAPLLAGSVADTWTPGLPLVVFPCGAIHENGKWLVTFGVNDYVCGWIEIPHEELVETMGSVEEF